MAIDGIDWSVSPGQSFNESIKFCHQYESFYFKYEAHYENSGSYTLCEIKVFLLILIETINESLGLSEVLFALRINSTNKGKSQRHYERELFTMKKNLIFTGL